MKKNKILIVEDESLLALGMQECLQNANYEVVAICNNGREALSAVQDKQPNLVLMDINLNGEMDGSTTALLIHSRFGIPVVFVTAYSDKPTLDRARLSHPYGFIVKPFKNHELVANVELSIFKHQREENEKK